MKSRSKFWKDAVFLVGAFSKLLKFELNSKFYSLVNDQAWLFEQTQQPPKKESTL